MDPDNPIVKLCAEGMQAEQAGRVHDAKRLYEQAWQDSSDDFEACISAHYLARQQSDDDARFRWNAEALERAKAVDDERVKGFWASLFLNMGHSHETRGEYLQARDFFILAREKLREVPASPYKDVVSEGILNGLKRTAGNER